MADRENVAKLNKLELFSNSKELPGLEWIESRAASADREMMVPGTPNAVIGNAVWQCNVL